MFSLPDIVEIDASIAKENELLRGAMFMSTSTELSSNALEELQEEIAVINARLTMFTELKELVTEVLALNYTQRVKNFTNEEVIKEYSKLISLANATIADFSISEEVEVKILAELKQ